MEACLLVGRRFRLSNSSVRPSAQADALFSITCPKSALEDSQFPWAPQACHPAGGSSNAACLGVCGQDLGTCAHGVATALQTCVTGCAAGAGRQSCIAGCVSAAQSSGATCASDFQSCTTACG